MEARVWLSYDLGVKGDYPGLYAWLDDHKAVECGDSIASFLYKCTNRDMLEGELLSELEGAVHLSSSDRLYIIYRKADGGVTGHYIHGRRKSNPWEGFGAKGIEESESESE